MAKTSNIIIRVTNEEREKANNLVELLGESNLSSMLRNYINDFYDLFYSSTKSDIDKIIEEIEEELKIGSLGSIDKQRKNIDLKLLKRVRDNYCN